MLDSAGVKVGRMVIGWHNLIRDLRVDLKIPELPFVEALTGQGGYELEPEGTWLGNLQQHVLPAQINAVKNRVT